MKRKKRVITGFNTDVEHDGVTYHVQTEDKGLETPLILSLVYTGGEILASKRVRYDDLVASGFDEKILADRLQRQHKLICAAIRAGRLDDLRRMSERDAATRAAAKKESAKEKPQSAPLELAAPEIFASELAPVEESILEVAPSSSEPLTPVAPPAAPMIEQPPAVSIPALLKKGGSRRAPAASTSKRLSSPKPAQQSRRVSGQEPVADFARAEVHATDALRLTLIDEKNYRGGDHIILRAHIAHGFESREPAGGAEVIVKILGSTFRPLILQSRAGADGIATFSIQLPHFRSGRAAILIRATLGSYEAELRRIIQQG
ncbi:MAG TPA: hypothetical protein VGC91_11140 [Pyrinomonadaceae bacterium]